MRSACSIDGCERAAVCRGMCHRHYKEARVAGRTCTIPGCEKPLSARGWCKMHHRRWERHGDPLKVLFIWKDAERRFWSKVDRRGPDECWPWIGLRQTARGYGVFSQGNRSVRAHRFVYELRVGPIPAGYSIDHRCHKVDECAGGPTCPHRLCCNPAHLLPVAPGVNNTSERCISRNAEKTHCPRGHEYTPENTKMLGSGSRACYACAKASGAARYQAKMALKSH
jgi:hypothetical protein